MTGQLPPTPSPFAPDDAWRRYHDARRRLLPAWAYDRDYVTGHALEQLPRVCAQLGTGEPVGVIPRPTWWFRPNLPESVRKLHGLTTEGRVALFRHAPGSYDLLFIDLAVGDWDCPNLKRRGPDLVDLTAWLLRLNDAKAAWRLARICGLQRPMP